MPQEIDCWCWMKELYSPATGVSDACLNLSKGPGWGRLSLLGLTTARLGWHNSPLRGLRVPDFFQDKSINGFAIICTHCIVPNLVLPESRTSGRFILFKRFICIIVSVSVCFSYMYACGPPVKHTGAHGGQDRVSHSQKQELKTVVRCHVEAGNWIWVLCKSNKCS